MIIPISRSGKKIILFNRRGVVLIDAVDFKRISKFKWYLNGKNGYACAYDRILKKKFYMHRFILNLGIGDSKVDHRNGDTFDNRRANLRVASHAANLSNQKIRSDNTSGYKGVSMAIFRSGRSRWAAYIHHKNKKINLGNFGSKKEAAAAYNTAAQKKFGEFARLNLI